MYMRVADKIFQRLESETGHVFFVPGGGAMYLVDALGKSKLKAISAIHEQGAGSAALGYAMYTNKLGVCLITSGPGSTNALTACAAAWMDSVPVLFISGQAKSETLVGGTGLRTRGVQEIDIINIVKPMTKFCYQPISSGYDCLIALDKMIFECMNGRRGPCWLAVPLDVQGINL
jgi:acetolactate synthase-1/2/3 large subunit